MASAGCEWCRSKTVPEFRDDEEMALFWTEHTPEQSGLSTRSLRPSRTKERQKKVSVTMLLDPWLKEALVEQATRRGIGDQTLARLWRRACRVGDQKADGVSPPGFP